MNFVSLAKNQVVGAVNKVVATMPQRTKPQTVTIDCPVERIEQFWRDPEQISVVLGDIAEIDTSGSDHYRWRLLSGPDVTWESTLVPESDGVQFVGTGDDTELDVRYRVAPRGMGTEVTLRVKTPAPGLLSGAAAYKVLYRLRALAQTGEVPTIASNPSARHSAR